MKHKSLFSPRSAMEKRNRKYFRRMYGHKPNRFRNIFVKGFDMGITSSSAKNVGGVMMNMPKL